MDFDFPHSVSAPFLLVTHSGQWLLVPGWMAAVTLPFCLMDKSWPLACTFGLTALLGLLIGFGGRCLRGTEKQTAGNAMASVALGWLLVAVFCGLPLYLSAQWMPSSSEVSKAYGSGINAFFEGMSGITSCGLTLSSSPDQLPMAVQWWRSLCEWVGGVGVVVMVLLLLAPTEHAYDFYRAEARSWQLGDSLKRTVLRIWVIFGGLTVFSILAMRWSGASWWEAVNHGMTAISTGGFSIKQDSFQSVPIASQVVAMVFMLLGGISFKLYHSIFFQRKWSWRKSTQLRGYLGLLMSGGFILWGIFLQIDNEKSVTTVLFQWISALGTCGFSAVDLSRWSAASLLILLVGMCIGGAAGSTTGGIKISRFVWIIKFMSRRMSERFRNRELPDFYLFDGKEMECDEARKRIRYALLLTSFWSLSLLFGWMLLLIVMPEQPPIHLLFEAVSALGSVGLTTGVTQADMPTSAKACLIGFMWLGRLEFVSVFMLVLLPLKRGNR
jgi:trk system potassium uptake protein TrkH